MGKTTQGLNTAGLMVGNTIATPLRRWGEVGNAVANILRQGKSSLKNTAEVGKQTLDALVDNFLNFSKVEGKWYQKILKVPLNLASAVTRRPAMIAGAGILSGANQSLRQPFKKLLYTPGKMFKWMRNATRIFSKKKGFDFAKYDTHETKWDTRVNQIKEKSFGFLGAKSWSAQAVESEKPKIESKPAEENKPEVKVESKSTEVKKEDKIQSKPVEEKKEEKLVEAKKEEKPIEEKKSHEEKKANPEDKKDKKIEKKSESEWKPNTAVSKPTGTHKSIDDIKKNDKEKSEKKDKDEQEKKFPERKNLDWKEKVEYKKECEKKLKGNLSKEWIIARGKEAKMWDSPEEIIKNLKEKDPTFAGYMEEEILAKAI